MSRPLPALDFETAEEWRLILTIGSTPFETLRLPSPGRAGSAFVDAAIVRHADQELGRRAILEDLRRRVGVVAPPAGEPSRSVVVCTHRRYDHLRRLLDRLPNLTPAPDEVIVVDNDPADEVGCRADVESAGARYVREDRRGLNNARNAGLRAARGDLVAFTDDDCIPADTWLRSLPALFADRTIAAVTGPAFPYSLETPASLVREDKATFARGLARRVVDWTVLPPTRANQIGSGANMTFRRSTLAELGEVFPPELDAGTPTESGGDFYALYKVLAAGYRIAYEPSSYVLHEHRADWAATHRTVYGYGVGLSATLTKLLVQHGELSAVAVWGWLVRQYFQSLLKQLSGQALEGELELARDYLRGALAGPRAWLAARPALQRERPSIDADRRGYGSVPRNARQDKSPDGFRDPGEAPTISVVCVTADRPVALRKCVSALARQTLGRQTMEVLIVDDSPDPHDLGLPPLPPETIVRRLETRGAGAAAARNAGAGAAMGEVLLMLDDDLVPDPELVARHLARHRQPAPERIVIGYTPPRPTRRTFAAMAAALWWEDEFRIKATASALTFVDLLAGNISISRATFERLGGFDERFGRFRREDWDWGIRALAAGVGIEYEPCAVAAHEFSLHTRGRLAAARAEGRGDALLVERYPFSAPSLPPSLSPRHLLRRPHTALLLVALRRDSARACAAQVLDALEALRLRRPWTALYDLAQQAARQQGMREGGLRAGPRATDVPVVTADLTEQEAIAKPRVATPLVELAVKGRPVARVRPEGGHWHSQIAERATAALGPAWWREFVPHDAGHFEATPEGRDLTSVAIVLGPDRQHGDDRHRAELERAGSLVETIDAPAALSWQALDAAVKEVGREIVVVPMPGVAVEVQSVAGARPGLDGDRIAAVIGCLEPRKRPGPLDLFSRNTRPAPYPLLGAAAYIAIRREAFTRLGGFEASAGSFGPYGPLLDFVDRALDHGYVVGTRVMPSSAHGQRGGRAVRRSERLQQHARGALMARRAIGMGGGRGSAWFFRRVVVPRTYRLLQSLARGPRATLGWLRSTLPFALGALAGARCALRLGAKATRRAPGV